MKNHFVDQFQILANQNFSLANSLCQVEIVRLKHKPWGFRIGKGQKTCESDELRPQNKQKITVKRRI